MEQIMTSKDRGKRHIHFIIAMLSMSMLSSCQTTPDKIVFTGPLKEKALYAYVYQTPNGERLFETGSMPLDQLVAIKRIFLFNNTDEPVYINMDDAEFTSITICDTHSAGETEKTGWIGVFGVEGCLVRPFGGGADIRYARLYPIIPASPGNVIEKDYPWIGSGTPYLSFSIDIQANEEVRRAHTGRTIIKGKLEGYTNSGKRFSLVSNFCVNWTNDIEKPPEMTDSK
jgi:hypothetical protein